MHDDDIILALRVRETPLFPGLDLLYADLPWHAIDYDGRLGTDLAPEEANHLAVAFAPFDVVVVACDDQGFSRVTDVARTLRASQLSVAFPTQKTSVRSQMRRAERFVAAFAVLIGGREVADGLFTIKDMMVGGQATLPAGEAVFWIDDQWRTREHYAAEQARVQSHARACPVCAEHRRQGNTAAWERLWVGRGR